jgi:chemotaxis protein methyltransferase CheR
MSAAAAVAERIAACFGLLLPEEAHSKIDEVLSTFAAARGTSRDALVRDASISLPLLQQIAGSCTIGETFFMRHRLQLETLADDLRSRLLAIPRREVIVWSAGCASGEEVYSVAMLAAERGCDLTRLCLLGSDLSHDAIARAQRATYNAWSMRNAPAWVGRHLLAEGHSFVVSQSLRTKVSFEAVSIQRAIERIPPQALDAVLFRNVAIYLAADACARFYERVWHALRPDGLLLLGPADPRPDAKLFDELASSEAPVLKPRRDARAPARAEKTPIKTPARTLRPVNGGHSYSTAARGAAPKRKAERDLTTVAKRADEGRVELATECATQLENADAGVPAVLVRAQLHLAAGRLSPATEDLRRVLYHAPSHKLARFWYVTALFTACRREEATAQLEFLGRELVRVSSQTVLEDGLTTAGELLAAVTRLRRSS